MKALHNYTAILEGSQKPRFKAHRSLLERNSEAAFRLLRSCALCERKCRVDRVLGEKGFCQAPAKPVITSMFDHYGEERFLVPSFTVFFWSCTFSCQFCQNWTISHRLESGTELSEIELGRIIDSHSYCKNVNFVGGEPTPYLPLILRTLQYVKSDLPVVWNSNFYMSELSMKLLKGLIDIYLSDWKYWSNRCAKRLSKVERYLEVVRRNHLLAFRDSELVIRHLVMPNHFDCCTKKILNFISENFKDKAVVNLMDQYRPEYKASNYKDINRHLTTEEFRSVVEHAEKLGINFVT